MDAGSIDEETMHMSEALFIGVKPRMSKKGKAYSTSWWRVQKEEKMIELSCFEEDLNTDLFSLKVTRVKIFLKLVLNCCVTSSEMLRSSLIYTST